MSMEYARSLVAAACGCLLGVLAPQAARAAFPAEAQAVALPAPDREGGLPLMKALALRKTTRGGYTGEPLPEQTLGNLLWAVWGVNRPDGRRTAPTALNRQEVTVYLALPDAVWRYEGQGHQLVLESRGDYRTLLKGGSAALFYAAPENDWGNMHIGSLYQNANLFCASAGLGCHVYASGTEAAARAVKLRAGFTIRIGQTIGTVR